MPLFHKELIPKRTKCNFITIIPHQVACLINVISLLISMSFLHSPSLLLWAVSASYGNLIKKAQCILSNAKSTVHLPPVCSWLNFNLSQIWMTQFCLPTVMNRPQDIQKCNWYLPIWRKTQHSINLMVISPTIIKLSFNYYIVGMVLIHVSFYHDNLLNEFLYVLYCWWFWHSSSMTMQAQDRFLAS